MRSMSVFWEFEEYRTRIERMVDAGHPLEFWDESMPWAAVLNMAASDRDFWEDWDLPHDPAIDCDC